jgi:hypothetical protein
VYELSRDLFRAIRPGLAPDARDPGRPARRLLAICEESVAQVAQTPSARRLHAARLFTRVRPLYPASEQLALLRRVDAAIEDVHDRLVARVGERSGGLMRCAAVNRRGNPCMREPIPGLRHCPSHRHLEAAAPLLAAAV